MLASASKGLEDYGCVTDIVAEEDTLVEVVVRSFVVVEDNHRGHHTVDQGRTT